MTLEDEGHNTTSKNESTNTTNKTDPAKTGYNHDKDNSKNGNDKKAMPTACNHQNKNDAPPDPAEPGFLAKTFIRERARARKEAPQPVCPAGRLIYDRTQFRYLSHLNDLFEENENYDSDDSLNEDSLHEDSQDTADT